MHIMKHKGKKVNIRRSKQETSRLTYCTKPRWFNHFILRLESRRAVEKYNKATQEAQATLLHLVNEINKNIPANNVPGFIDLGDLDQLELDDEEPCGDPPLGDLRKIKID